MENAIWSDAKNEERSRNKETNMFIKSDREGTNEKRTRENGDYRE